MNNKEHRFKNKIICCDTCVRNCDSYSTEKIGCLNPRSNEIQIQIVNGIKWKSIWHNSYNNWKTKINYLPDELFEI